MARDLRHHLACIPISHLLICPSLLSRIIIIIFSLLSPSCVPSLHPDVSHIRRVLEPSPARRRERSGIQRRTVAISSVSRPCDSADSNGYSIFRSSTWRATDVIQLRSRNLPRWTLRCDQMDGIKHFARERARSRSSGSNTFGVVLCKIVGYVKGR